MSETDCVHVVDDDEAVRDSLRLLLKTIDIPCRVYASGNDFVNAFDPAMSGCILLDIRMPGMSGLEVQQALNEKQNSMPIIFVTGHGDVPMAVKAMHNGAFDFLEKPYREQELLDRIQQARSENRSRRQDCANRDHIAACIERLTPREREVMDRVVTGQANKVIAADLQLSERTVEIHRARVMEKMEVRNLASLVRAAVAVQRPDS